MKSDYNQEPVPRESIPCDSVLTNRLAVIVFSIGLTVWIIAQLALVSGPVWQRALPPEVDDSYSYLLKAAQLSGCFWQDCAALTAIREQMSEPSQDPHTLWNRIRVHDMVYVIYHPLYSALLLLLKPVAGSWEMAMKILWMLCIPFFGVVFGWWLRVVWGMGAAGIALGFLAFDVFGGQGLHYVVPSNVTLGVAVLLWAHLTARKGNAPVALIIGTWALVLLHPVGRIYAVMAALLALLLTGWPRTLRAWLPFVGSGLLVAGTFLLPLVVDRPELRFPEYPLKPGQTWGALALATLQVASNTLLHWAHSLGMPIVVATLVGAGYMLAESERRWQLLKTTLVIGLFLLISFFYSIPQLPAELFVRLSIPFLVLLSGAIGQVIWAFISRVQFPDASPFPLARRVLVGVFILLLLFPQKITYGISDMQGRATYMMNRHAFRFDMQQPQQLANHIQPGDYVFHQDEFLLLFFLTHGGLYHQTIYAPVLAYPPASESVLNKEPGTSHWLETRPIRFAIIWNPIELMMKEESLLNWIISREGEIITEELNGMRLKSRIPSPGTDPLRILVRNISKQGETGIIEVVPFDEQGKPVADLLTTVAIPAGWSGWLPIDLGTAHPFTDLQLRFLHAPMRIGGIVFGDDRDREQDEPGVGNDGMRRTWPWTQRALLTLITSTNETFRADFDATTPLPYPLNTRKVTVLADHGVSALVRVEPE